MTQAFAKSNNFYMKKDINTIFRDKKLLKTFVKNNSQSMINNNPIKIF